MKDQRAVAQMDRLRRNKLQSGVGEERVNHGEAGQKLQDADVFTSRGNVIRRLTDAEHSPNMRGVGGSSPSGATNSQDSSDQADGFKKFKIIWGSWEGRPECPYFRRWVVVMFGYSIRLHYWVGSDDLRFHHDHPWPYLSIVLRGGYFEHTPETEASWNKHPHVRSAGSIKWYPAEHRHKVEVGTTALTLLITGRPCRKWGFWIPGRDRVMRPLRYFSRYGHHPCDD